MSTRSNIIIKEDDGYYYGIYCHNDGGLSHNGRILLNYYNDKEKVKKLIELGDLCFLDENINIPEGVIHSYDNRHPGICIFYGRDRGELCTSKIKLQNIEDVLNYANNTYCYLFANEKWFFKLYNMKEFILLNREQITGDEKDED